MVEHYRVQVDKNGEMVLVIESGSLCGIDMSEEDISVVKGCALNLLSFIGHTPREELAQQPTNTGSPKLPLDINEIDRAVCNERGFGFDVGEIVLMHDFVIPIIERQLRASA